MKPLVRDGEPPKVYLSVTQAARRLGVSRWTVRRMVGAGELAAVDVHGMTRIDEQELTRYIAEHPHNTGS